MSVPLDRLYNFLRDSSDHDIIIYRYFPHGSKNLADLHPLDKINVVHKVCLLHMLCHDQEPLDCSESFFGDSRLLRQMIHCGENFWPKCLVLHSELNSDHVKAISNVAEPVYYWSHALIARDWFRYAQKDPGLQAKDIKQTFLIYNRAWSGTREYRLHVANQLVTHDLTRHCLTAFNPIDHVHFSQHQFVNEKFRPKHNLEQYFASNTHPSWASADYNCEDYRHTKIEVVLETLFDDSRIHLTEKTLRPIACGQPFLLASTPGSLRYLQSYGFETFDPVIDEQYDQIVDPVDRIDAVVEQMQRLVTHDRPTWLQNELMARCRYNQKRFFSDEFFQTVVNEYKQNLDQAAQRVTSTIDCTYIHKFLKHSKWQHKYTKQDAKEIWLRYHALTKNR